MNKFVLTFILGLYIFLQGASLVIAQNQQQTQPNNPNSQGPQASRTSPTQTQQSQQNNQNAQQPQGQGTSVGVGTTTATSNTCTTKVGEPSGTPKDVGCNTTGSSGGSNPGMGKYSFPLKPDSVTGIATEMAAYPGGYAYEGHREHAGLDIGTPINGHAPVYAVADGTVTYARESCFNVPDGWLCRLDISHNGDNLISSYSHFDANSKFRVGAPVKKGEQIGVVHFWTQYQNMDHLHFELLDKNRKSSLGVGWNLNPRNYFPELQRWKPDGYGGTGQAVRNYTNSVGLFWADDGKEFAETYRNHPPCSGDCWAH